MKEVSSLFFITRANPKLRIEIQTKYKKSCIQDFFQITTSESRIGEFPDALKEDSMDVHLNQKH